MTERTVLSPAQRRIWLQEQIGGAPGATHRCVANLLTGPLDVDRLRDACADVLARHPVLRTVYRSDGAGPVPEILAEASVLDMVDLADVPAADRLDAAWRTVVERNRGPFDLEREVPVRVTLCRLSETESLLAVTLHRIAVDDACLGLLAAELSASYAGRRPERPPVTHAPPRADDDAAYWREQLGDVPHVLDLPTDRPRDRASAFRGRAVPFALDEDTTRAVRARGGTGGVVVSLLASFATLLHRYTAMADVIVGVPVSRPATPGVLGCFADLVPIRVHLGDEPDLDRLLARVAEAHRRGCVTGGMPFERIVEVVSPQRLSGQPLAQVMLSVRDSAAFALRLDGVRSEPVDLPGLSGQLDLAVSVVDGGGTLSGFLEYNEELFDAATVERVARQWQVLLADWLAHPGKHPGELAVLSDEDEQRMLHEWNATARPLPGPSLDELFLAQAARFPDRVAIVTAGGQWTYRWLEERSAALAAELTRRGVSFEEPVAIGLPRSPEFFVAVLAVLRCHATYLALDPGYPMDRLRYMMSDSGARILLTEREQLDHLPGEGVEVVLVGEGSRHGRAPRLPEVPLSRVAYLIYTSGSSGVPKAVMGTHSATLNRLRWMWQEYPFTDGDLVCQKASLCFGDSVWETLGGLLQGVPTLVLADEEVRDPDRFVSALARGDVSRCTLVPSMLWLLTGRPDVARRLVRLRIVVSSGEALDAELARRIRAVLPDTLLLNLYGSSELAADVTAWECLAADDSASVPIGRPIANAGGYVLDAALRPVPVGVDGELFVGGAGLARGYAGRPGMTADRFVPNPYGPGRLYRTGDRCRWRPDGVLEYLGRLDDQVKVRGMRVEPAEVEDVVAQCPGVATCAVVGRSFGPGDVRLVCFVVPESGRRPDRTFLRRFARGRLPEFMVPSLFVSVAELPMTASGKVERRSLVVPAFAPDGPDGSEPAGSELERKVADVWAEILEVDRLTVRDNFFALGGNSIRMMSLATRLSTLLSRDVSMRTLYVNQSVEDFCRALETDPAR